MADIDILVDVDNPEAIKRQQTLKEMARRSQDRIRIYNPLLEDYTVMFDGIGFVVPNRNKDNGYGFGMAIVPQYVAENYRTQIIDKILTEKMDEAIRIENERRHSLGMADMTKWVGGEEPQFSQGLRTDNREARKRLIPVVWKGLAERYGTDMAQASLSGKPKDDRPLDQQLADEMSVQAPTMPYEAPKVKTPTDYASKDVFTLRKIAKEKGIETSKTDKKDELLKKISQ